MNKISKNLSIEEVQERIVLINYQLDRITSLLHYLLLKGFKKKHPVDIYLRLYLDLKSIRHYMSEVKYWVMENHPEWFVQKFPRSQLYKRLLNEKQNNLPENKSNKDLNQNQEKDLS
ncbi:MAG: hypothetical protein ACXITR_01295 [Cyanobacterium sp.]